MATAAQLLEIRKKAGIGEFKKTTTSTQSAKKNASQGNPARRKAVTDWDHDWLISARFGGQGLETEVG